MASAAPRSVTWRPPVGARINTADPLANGLICCVLANEGAGLPYDIAQRRYLTYRGDCGWGYNSHGLGLSSKVDSQWILGVEGTDFPGVTEMTMMYRKQRVSGALKDNAPWGPSNADWSSGDYANAQQTSTGQIYFLWVGSSGSLGSLGTDPENAVWMFRASADTNKAFGYWAGGPNDRWGDISGTQPTRTPSAEEWAFGGAYQTYYTDQEAEVVTNWLYLWNRGLTDAEILRVREDPYCFLVWDEPRPALRKPTGGSTYTASVACTTGGIGCDADGTFSPGTHTAAVAATVGGADTAAAATFAPGTHTATVAAVVGGADTAAAATFSGGTHTASAACLVGGADTAASASFVAPVYTATVAALLGGVDTAVAASFASSISIGTAAVEVGGATSSSSATFTASPVTTLDGVAWDITVPTNAPAWLITFDLNEPGWPIVVVPGAPEWRINP